MGKWDESDERKCYICDELTQYAFHVKPNKETAKYFFGNAIFYACLDHYNKFVSEGKPIDSLKTYSKELQERLR